MHAIARAENGSSGGTSDRAVHPAQLPTYFAIHTGRLKVGNEVAETMLNYVTGVSSGRTTLKA